MLPRQKAAIDHYMEELTAAVPLSYFHATAGILSSSDLPENLFHILKTKDDAWSHLLSYLNANNNSPLADKLQIYADEEPAAQVVPKLSALELFSHRLAKYYRLFYGYLPTMPTIRKSHKHVRYFWLPLQIEDQSEGFMGADNIDHIELLNRLTSTEGRNVALIRGGPGMGKTTLAKKIACDWAFNYGSTDAHQFSLVLAVPLRHDVGSGRFDQLAIDYYLSILYVEDIDKVQLIREIDLVKSNLLVILDGLGEYSTFAESSIRDMFVSKTPPAIPFKLIITSTPYACERATKVYFPLRFDISPLDANLMKEFVQFYCQTAKDVANVTELIETNAKKMLQVPLLLTFACLIVDSTHELPTSMTNLYGSLVRLIITRANCQGYLKEPVCMQTWQESKVVKSNCELAYRGCTEAIGMFEFSKAYREKSHVTNDSLTCGFLRGSSYYYKECNLVEFPHSSIQEYLAALHCYQLMLSGRTDVLEDVGALILNRDYQVGQFFFGICSEEGQFERTTGWARPALLMSTPYRVSWLRGLADAIVRIYDCLVDCTQTENLNFARLMFQSTGDLSDMLFGHWDQYLFLYNSPFRCYQLPAAFTEALRLHILTDSAGRTYGWYLRDCQKYVRYAVVFNKPPLLLEQQFEQVETLVLSHRIDNSLADDWATKFDYVKSLPPVTALLMSISCKNDTSVTFCISYGRALSSSFTKFRVGFNRDDRVKLLTAIEKEKFVEMTVYKTSECVTDGCTFRQLNVTVSDCYSQSSLIFSLIRFSVIYLNYMCCFGCT